MRDFAYKQNISHTGAMEKVISIEREAFPKRRPHTEIIGSGQKVNDIQILVLILYQERTFVRR